MNGVTSTGLITRTASGTYAARTITAGTGISITNGSGISGNPTVTLATLADDGTGSFLKLTRDTYGRISGTTAVVESDITALVDSTYVNASGDTMSGSLNMGANAITNASALVIGGTSALSTERLSVQYSNASSNASVRILNTGTTASTYSELLLTTNTNVGVGANTSIRSTAEDTSGNTKLSLYTSLAGTQTERIQITSDGNLYVLTKATFGYASSNTGGTVTQSTSKATGVTLNAPTGQITLNASSLGATTTTSFTLTNSYITSTSNVIVNRVSGGTNATYIIS